MMIYTVGSMVRFGTYRDGLSAVPEVFASGDMLLVLDVEEDGVVRCALADFTGQPIMDITDTLFVEELALVSL